MMDNFSINYQVEDCGDYFSVSDYFLEIESNFKDKCKSLLAYRKISSISEYRAAAEEAFENASEEMSDFMEQYFGINSANDFLIFLEGMEFNRNK
jgi:hypothetical protein